MNEDEMIGRGFAVFGLVMFLAAFLINRAAMKLLNEAQSQADIWAERLDESVALAEEAKVIYANAVRLLDRAEKTP